MTLVKITNYGDGNGALCVYKRGSIPTYGETLMIADREFEVTEVRRFTSPKRQDSVRVSVQAIADKDIVV